MDAERLKRIEEIYHAAMEVTLAERDSLVGKACADDEELRGEVESLLAVSQTSNNIFETPLESLAAEMFSQKEARTNLAGREISHYKIVRLLDSGGMGEVYLAEDARLRRKVALKILPPLFSADTERKKRFEKEARAVSSLNHPNIITIYEIEEAQNLSFMATEFIDGQTLRELLGEKHLTWQEAVKIAIQIAGALESAHVVGIVHRDIKPANIMIRRDGIVKVLDFGLAKLTAPESGDFESREQTAPHRVMGTIHYMSPEQALGERIDARTDIFSFGVVLYEMLTNDLPFAGASDAAIYNATIHKTLPSICDSNGEIPAALDRIVKHALEKDRDARYQIFGDLRADLKKLLRDSQTNSFDYAFANQTVSATGPNKQAPPTGSFDEIAAGSRISRVWLLVPLLILGSAFVFYWQHFYNRSAGATNFQSTKLDVLTAHGLTRAAAISPDGKYIVYAKDENGKQSLWLRQTASAGDTQIVPAENTRYKFLRFSRDGNFLYFVGVESEDQPPSLYQITLLGRNQRKLIADVDSQISFSPDGKQIAFVRVSEADYSIVIADEQGGSERILRTRKFPEVYTDEVSWSPDGTLIAVPTLTRGVSYAGGIAVVDVATGRETPLRLTEEKLLRIGRIAWVNDGEGLIYTLYAAHMGQRYQLRYAAFPSGEVQNVTNDLSSYEDFSLTADSQTMVAVQREYSMGIWLTPENDFSSAVGINSKTGADDGERGLSWTKDGKVVFVSSQDGTQKIWRMDADGSNPMPLTTDVREGTILPTLSNGGGGAITYFGGIAPVNSFFQMDSDGQNVRRVVEDDKCSFAAAASANQDWVVYTSIADGNSRIWKIPLKGGEAVKLTEVDSTAPVISRDGRLVAYFIREKGKPVRLGISSIDGGDPLKTFELPATTNIDAGLAWNKTGSGILFVNTLGTTSNIWTQPVDGAPPIVLTAFKEFQIAQFALNAEGSRLAVARGSRDRDIVLIKNLRK